MSPSSACSDSPHPPLSDTSIRRAEISKDKLCHVKGGNKIKVDGSVMGQDFGRFSYGFCGFRGGRAIHHPFP